MSVDLSSLGRAIDRLAEAAAALRIEPGNLLYRDAVIKRFEFTYELCISTMRRFVDEYSTRPPATERPTTPELIRTASQDGLLQSGWDVWHGYREARNKTSHTYNEDQANSVLAAVPGFLAEAQFLLARMAEKNQ